MNSFKRRPDLSTEKAVQSVMTNSFMRDDYPNVCRFEYIVSDKMNSASNHCSLGILGRIKLKFQHIIDNLL